MPSNDFAHGKFELGSCYISGLAFGTLANCGVAPAALLELHATLAPDHRSPDTHRARIAALATGAQVVSA